MDVVTEAMPLVQPSNCSQGVPPAASDYIPGKAKWGLEVSDS